MISQNSMAITKNYCLNNEYLKWYSDYKKYLGKLNIKNESIEWRLKNILAFLHYLECKKIKLVNLKPKNVYDAINKTTENVKSRTKENRIDCIRMFIVFLYQKKIIRFSGTDIIPKIKRKKYSEIPSFYSDEEIIKIIETSSKILNKKEYCIILFFALYGLRRKDVQNLKLENIKWNDNKIIFTQNKDNDINELPLILELRYSLIEYLKNERINYKSDYLFLNSNGDKISDNELYEIVNSSFKKAGITTTNKHHGPHSLRHSLATSLLNQGKSIKEISAVILHNNFETTKVYARTNLNDLKKISLEVPTWKN